MLLSTAIIKISVYVLSNLIKKVMEIFTLIDRLELANDSEGREREFYILVGEKNIDMRIFSSITGIMEAAQILRDNVYPGLRIRIDLHDFTQKGGFKRLVLNDWQAYLNFLQFRILDCAVLNCRDYSAFMLRQAALIDRGMPGLTELSVYDLLCASFKFPVFEVKAAGDKRVTLWLYDEEKDRAIRGSFYAPQLRSDDNLAKVLKLRKIDTPELFDFAEQLKVSQPENKFFQKLS